MKKKQGKKLAFFYFSFVLVLILWAFVAVFFARDVRNDINSILVTIWTIVGAMSFGIWVTVSIGKTGGWPESERLIRPSIAVVHLPNLGRFYISCVITGDDGETKLTYRSDRTYKFYVEAGRSLQLSMFERGNDEPLRMIEIKKLVEGKEYFPFI